MKSNLSRIVQSVFCEPWLTTPSHHATVSEIVRQHITGTAHTLGGCAALYDESEKDNCIMPEMRGDIAVIPVCGTLGMRVSGLSKSSGMCDYLDIQAALEMAIEDPDARGIVLSFDSPGGAATGCPETAAMIAEIASRMSVVAFTDSMCASGAYWLASQCNAIISTGSALSGSIGVYISMLDDTGWFAQNGLKTELFTTGKYKAAGISGKPLTDDQRAYFQSLTDSIFTDFKAAVTSQRETTDEAMQGQVFTARDAMAAGLIDEIGGLDAAITAAREIADYNERKKQ